MANNKRARRRVNRDENFRESLQAIARPDVQADPLALKRTISLMLGLTALALAVSGLIPALSPNNHVWGLFDVNAVHTGIHFIFGAAAVYAAFRASESTGIWRGAAIFFGALTILGLFSGERPVLGLIENNAHDVWLHATKAIGFSYLGWAGSRMATRQR